MREDNDSKIMSVSIVVVWMVVLEGSVSGLEFNFSTVMSHRNGSP